MTRAWSSLVLFLILFLLETSFATSLPFPFALIPLTFSAAIFRLQHRGLSDGAVWVLAYGLLLQVLPLSASPLPALSWGAAALVSLVSARHIFSNRSLLGVVATGVAGYAAHAVLEATVGFVSSFRGGSAISLGALSEFHGTRIVLFTIMLVILFYLSRTWKRYVQT
ncbi:hypothetical protein FJZ23_03335 [Candidatus Parcubacteria bacterium]|nr:hypothetical protein [Candidatus Parcubacteria bacterium]